MPIMSRNPLCTVNKQFFSQRVSSIHFQPASVFLKGRMGAVIAPSWAMNIPHFKITTGPGGMMIVRLPRFTTPTIEYCFLRTDCQFLWICFVASRTFWDGIWLWLLGKLKEQLPFGDVLTVWPLCTMYSGNWVAEFFQDHILSPNTYYAVVMPIKLQTYCGLNQ